MRKFCVKMLLVVFLLIGCGCSPTTFYYKMSKPSGYSDDIASYRAPAGDFELENVFGDDVRNVIFCIGDGMGSQHVSLARHVGAGPDKQLWMELLPVRGQMKTHSANKSITDSAAAGTAMACGIKTNNGMIGMTPKKAQYSSILELLAQDGWKTGLVVTCQMTHATPASFAAHVKGRNDQVGIAPQMLANHVDVMLGGGRKYWLPKDAGGIRKDELDLLEKARSDGYQVIATRDELGALTQTPVLGLFGDDGLTTFEPEPMLAEMSRAAIRLLSEKNENGAGFFLMIEGSQIDWAAHANDTDRVVRQTLLFDLAVREAIEFAKWDGHTLVIVTADHETGGLVLKPDDSEASGVKAKWTTGGHTDAKVPIFAFGPGSEKFAGTMDNIDISKRIAELTGIEQFPVVKDETKETDGTVK